MDTYYECDVSRLVANSNVYTVKIPKESTSGSRFGTCTCGIPKQDGLPCVHMVVLDKGGHIEDPGLTRLSVMPSWLTTNHWCQQFPENSVSRGNITISSIKSKYSPDDMIQYCSDWAAPKKAGRPKKDSGRKPGVMDAIANAGRKKRKKRKKTMWCNICPKFNHNTRDCFKNPSNLPGNEFTVLNKFDFGVATGDNNDLGNGVIREV